MVILFLYVLILGHSVLTSFSYLFSFNNNSKLNGLVFCRSLHIIKSLYIGRGFDETRPGSNRR